MSYRPGGVIAIAIFFIIFGALGVIAAIGYLISIEMNITSSTYTSLGILLYLSSTSGYTTHPFLLGTALNAPLSWQSVLNTAYITIPVGVVFAALFVITAVGLLRMKNWGRILALIFGILMIIGGAIGLLVIVGIIPLVFGIVVVAYLMGSVKDEFE
jgi:uncharacterized membrane protein (DUF2068 family)